MTTRRIDVMARVLAGAAVGAAVGLLYDRNAGTPGIDWGAVVAAAVTLGSLLLAYEALAWLGRLGMRHLLRAGHGAAHATGTPVPAGDEAKRSR